MKQSDPASRRPVLSAIEVAELLGWKTVESFRNNRRRLEAAGFPKKLPGAPGWSRAAVMRWIDSDAGSGSVPAEPAINIVRVPGPTPLERRFAS
ncbi:hypothetical protein LB566_23340 [Mesorhizobium sp. CA13]|uniref:hypothetical protein n=1 Tax=Mesorhizobium sp. CA13 TaxID=2876643 RepID=UPI001CCBAB73|nr:hypothetical protein [Mesorhizobium sp. CA13]MBZ9856730.1 hypothetical protein [Mesorhizobium sp. CA13]